MNQTYQADQSVTAIRRVIGCAIFACLLTSCSGSTSSGITESTPTTKSGSSAEMLAQVRAAGEVGNELDVQPLRDPQVEDLRNSAMQAEQRGDYAAANRTLAQALLVSPNDPDILQWQAELALVTRQWKQAAALATLSYQNGPKLGGLCRRNWTTIGLATEAQGDSEASIQAQQQVAACKVPPPTRM